MSFPIRKLTEIIEPAIMRDPRSYWAMHFCAVFETLYEHNRLEFTFPRTVPNNEVMSPANLLSYSRFGFFAHMKKYIHNWGLQYLMCHYLRSYEGRNAIVKLLEGLSNIHKVDLLMDCESYGVRVCGVDSNSGGAFLNQLKESGAIVLGYNGNTISNVWNDIKYVDLCILINKRAGMGPSIAVLGEVEGNHGIKMTRRYFGKKSSVCSFGLGVKPEFGTATIDYKRTESGDKVVIMMGSDFDVIADFHSVIDEIERFFEKGPQVNVIRQPGLNDVVDLIKFYWRKPIYELMNELRKFIKVHSQAEDDTNPLTPPITVNPKLIIGG